MGIFDDRKKSKGIPIFLNKQNNGKRRNKKRILT